MKKLLSLLLALLLTLCAAAPALTEETHMVLPLVENLLDAPIGNMSMEDGVSFSYEPATEDHLLYYLTLSAMVGTYAYEMPNDHQQLQYLLVSPGSSTMAIAVFTPAKKTLDILTDGLFIPMVDEDAQGLYNFLADGFVYPQGKSGYILPEFWALAGVSPVSRNTIQADHIFNGQKTYFETYTGIDFDVINTYTQLMLLYGFNVMLDAHASSTDSLTDPIWLHFTNQDMEMLVQYSLSSQMAQVYTKPGVSPMPYLLNQREIQESLAR